MSRFKISRRQMLKGAGFLTVAAAAGVKVTTAKAQEPENPDFPRQGFFIPSEDWSDGDIVEADLLIVGSGYAGVWAAISAADNGVKNIVIVDKGSIGNSSVASLTLGTSDLLVPEGQKDKWLEELAKASGYICRQDTYDDMLSTSVSRLQKLEQWGLTYDLHGMHSDGNKYVAISFGSRWQGRVAGKAVMGVLMNQMMNRKGIRYYSKTLITGLLKNDGRIAGAVGVGRMTGGAITFKAKSVIIAAGQCSFSGQHMLMELMTGNGYALAYNAGTTLNNMEFLAFDIDPGGYGLEGASLLGAFGARVINNRNDDFMWKYDPVNGMDSHVNTSTRAMAKEVKAGRGPVYLDRTRFCYSLAGQYMWKGLLPDGSWQKMNELRLGDIGHDVTKQLDSAYSFSFGIIGAVRADAKLQTDIPGLYVAGVTYSQAPGKVKGIESARAFWSGEKTGKNAAEYIKTVPSVTINEVEMRDMVLAAKAPLGQSGSVTPSQLLEEIQKTIFPYYVSILKREDNLVLALDRIMKIKQEWAPKMYATDSHELVKYHEANNMLLCAELYLRASIERKESRECHYREDYPETDNGEWLKWITFVKGPDGKPKMGFEKVPVDQYKFKPQGV